jgi:hypothetical protein
MVKKHETITEKITKIKKERKEKKREGLWVWLK